MPEIDVHQLANNLWERALLGSIGAGRLAAGLVKLAVDGPARLVLLTST